MAAEYQKQAPEPSQAQAQEQINAPTLILPQGYYPISQAGGAAQSPIQYIAIAVSRLHDCRDECNTC